MKTEIFKKTEENLRKQGFDIVSKDDHRPWGGFFVIHENQAQKFSDVYFGGMDISSWKITSKLSPKILIIEPHQRLSWQYHHRRAEIWQVKEGNVGVIRSMNNEQGEMEELGPGSRIVLQQGERHRLIGLQEWAVIAEIWQHTDPDFPSDEEDIIRLQDDFGR